MKKLNQLIACLFTLTSIAQNLPAELQTPELVSINRMPMRSSAFAFENIEKAKQYGRERSN